jgi:predicted nucleic acid-binding protein
MTRSIEVPQLVFVDTSAYYAIADPRDQDSTAARETLRWLVSGRAQLYTTNFVVAELHALFITRGNRESARRALQTFDRSRSTTVVRATEDDERRAKEIVLQYDDKDFSLTDAISFAVMERLGITHAFTLDRHFQQYGWQVVEAPRRQR